MWAADSDQSSGAVTCKPLDQVSELGKTTYAMVRAWRIITDLPFPL